uniref:Regulatory factor X associated protein n=1 Tax=Malurus cyaneus samueli TaxID=2593467 RepID=A0A8C5TN49_9PASS
LRASTYSGRPWPSLVCPQAAQPTLVWVTRPPTPHASAPLRPQGRRHHRDPSPGTHARCARRLRTEAAGGESTASLEELEEEEVTAAAAASGETTAGGECKSCTYQGCNETTTQVVKQRKPWMCKRHRNKIYKDKYKRKKSDQALGGGGAAAAGGLGRAALGGQSGCLSVTKQRTGSVGDRPARPTLLEQVLNKKRLVSLVFKRF